VPATHAGTHTSQTNQAGQVRFGACRPPDDAALAAGQGWDFLELPFGQLGVLDAPAACAAVKDRLAAAGMHAESFHRFLPAHLRLVGDDLDVPAVTRYVETALARVAAIGGRLAVFSGGRGRTIAEGYSRERARDQFVDVLRRAGDAAAGHGITLVLEPLNRKETNFVNSVTEGAGIVRAAGHPSVRLMADLYHMVLEEEPFAALDPVAGLLAHVHVADTGRFAPGTGTYDYPGFFGALRRIGYTGLIAAENTWRDFPVEGGPSVTFLHHQWRTASQPAS
jgi:sugar phosphate isomerase/epimerase